MGAAGKIIKLFTTVFSLYPFTNNLILLIFPAEKEWMTEKDSDTYKINFYSHVDNYFVGRMFPWNSKCSHTPNRIVFQDLRKSCFFLEPESSYFQKLCRFPFLTESFLEIVIFVFIYFNVFALFLVIIFTIGFLFII